MAEDEKKQPRQTFELPVNYNDMSDEMKIRASEDVYRRQSIWRWGKWIKEMQDEGRI